MTNKMLIDASHPEETRVAVVRGNRVEEFDFESQEKRQLRGNIYLAKVTRVEPSLQAAFVDYGGNRHGFLAFSEIHPDYYQIPVADRQALLEAEAEEARANREEEEAEDNKAEAEEEKPHKKRTRRKKPAAKKAAEEDQSDSEETSDKNSEETEAEAKSDEVADTDDAPEPAEAEAEVAEEADASEPEAEDGDEPTSMAAMVEMDSISEPLPEDADDDQPEETEDSTDEVAAEEEKPKRKTTRRRTSRKKKTDEAPAETEEAAAAEGEAEAVATDGEADEAEEKPAKKAKPRKRASRAKKKADPKEETEEEASEVAADTDEANSKEANGEDDDVESVGQQDAMEEVPVRRRNNRRHYKIQEVIKRRQVLLVQVVKEERGNKGAALTTYLSLAGRYSVLMPNTARGGGISRKITNANDRKRLKTIASELEVPEGMGVILRTAGAARTKVEIKRDFEYLMRQWEQVRSLTLSSSAPCLVYEEGSLIKRSIRDLYDKNTGEIVVSGDAGYQEAKDFMTMLMPSHAKHVKHYNGAQAIFAKHGVDAQLDRMVTPQVTLKSGGYLVINQTEALVAVDVNSGRSTREHSIEDTALQTNLEASEEVARQLRLRDMAGLIVIDFIDMEEKRNNRAVEKKLKDCLKNDRARIQVGRISHFGLMEMSRQRMRASVLESTMDPCPHCGGMGHVRSDSAIALHIFRAIEEHLTKHNRHDVVMKTSPAIAIHILNYKRASLTELEERYGLQIIIEGDPSIQGQEFKIEKGSQASGESNRKSAGNSPASDNASDDDGDKKKGRNRRRNSKNAEQENDIDASVEGEEESNAAQAEDDDDEKPKKRRRRGKRGGRRNKNSDAEDASAAQSDSEQDDANDNQSEAKSPQDTADNEQPAPEAAADEVEEKPKAKRTRRKAVGLNKRKTSDEKTEEVASKAAAAEPSETITSEDETPRKSRNTRRPRKPAKDASETKDAVAIEASADVADSASDGEEPKDKKSGWWPRGGGFF